MDPAAKKHALRLVPYGLYLLGARRPDGTSVVSLASWFTQTSFQPPLAVVGMHREGAAFAIVKETRALSLNILGSGQLDLLKAFFKHVEVEDGKAAGHAVVPGAATGCPILLATPAALELTVREVLELGDHATVVAEIVGAVVHDAQAKPMTHPEAKLHYAG